MLDVVLALIAIVLLSPAFLIIAILAAISSPGPALFNQVRVGRHGREFRMWKFRTMDVNADDEIHRRYVTAVLAGGRPGIARGGARLQKLEHDPRVTTFGAFLRRWSLDELPQLFNVLGGDVRVGPRPVLPCSPRGSPPAPLRGEAGITGLWQVCGRSAVSMLEALDLDVEYVVTRSFALDLAILIGRSPPCCGRGRRRERGYRSRPVEGPRRHAFRSTGSRFDRRLRVDGRQSFDGTGAEHRRCCGARRHVPWQHVSGSQRDPEPPLLPTPRWVVVRIDPRPADRRSRRGRRP